MHFEVKPDGTYDVTTGSFSLLGCYPAIDGEKICVTSLKISPGKDSTLIEYSLPENRTVALQLISDSTGLGIECELRGFHEAPHWVHPLASARLHNVHRLFRQGIGFSGPTGFINLKAEPDLFSHESYLVTGLLGEDEYTITIAAHEHDFFLQKTHLESRAHRRQFRNREIDRKEIYLEAGFSTERIPLPEGKLHLPALHLRSGEKPWDTLRQTAQEIATQSNARVHQPPNYHWCSWYDRASFLTHHELTEFLNGVDRLPEKPRYIQIDDGYEPHKGDWLLTNSRWPEGMPAVFAEIQKHGLIPGIWVGPFMVGSRSQLAAEHPDWLLKDVQGNIHADWKHYDGTSDDEETYVLDTSHPEAMRYIENVFRTFREAGVRFFKTDFLEWGYKDSTRFRRHTPGKTSAQYFHDVVKTIRGAIGEDSHWLGCISYFAPCIGFVDSMRVGSDVGPQWSSHGGTGNDGVGGGVENMLMETFGTQYFNNIFWQNDPDATFFRTHYMGMNESEITALAYWNGIMGTSINTSDRLDLVPPHRLDLWNFVKPQSEKWTAIFPFWTKSSAIYVAVRYYEKLEAWAVLFLNHTSKPALEHCRVIDLIGLEEGHVYEWSPRNSTPLGLKRELVERLEGHSARLYFVSKHPNPPPAKLTLGGAYLD